MNKTTEYQTLKDAFYGAMDISFVTKTMIDKFIDKNGFQSFLDNPSLLPLSTAEIHKVRAIKRIVEVVRY